MRIGAAVPGWQLSIHRNVEQQVVSGQLTWLTGTGAHPEHCWLLGGSAPPSLCPADAPYGSLPIHGTGCRVAAGSMLCSSSAQHWKMTPTPPESIQSRVSQALVSSLHQGWVTQDLGEPDGDFPHRRLQHCLPPSTFPPCFIAPEHRARLQRWGPAFPVIAWRGHRCPALPCSQLTARSRCRVVGCTQEVEQGGERPQVAAAHWEKGSGAVPCPPVGSLVP